MVGQFDNCLFSLHKPQSMDRTTVEDSKDKKWKRMVCDILTCLPLCTCSSFEQVPLQDRWRKHRPPTVDDGGRRPHSVDNLRKG